jgi:hypothetical protein
VDHGGNGDATWWREALYSRSNIDAVAVHVATFGNNVTQMNTNAKFDLAVFRNVGISRGHGLLNRYRTGDRIHNTGEFSEKPITHGLEEAPLVLGNLGFDHLGAEPPYCRESTILILTHKTTVANHIGRQDSGKAALDVRVAHLLQPPFLLAMQCCHAGHWI